MRLVWLLFFVPTTLLAVRFAIQEPKPAQPLTIVFTSDWDGSLEPCGCSGGSYGGIKRFGYALRALMRQGSGVIWLDGGNFAELLSPQGEVKTRYLLRAQQQLGCAAALTADREFAYSLAGQLRQFPHLLATNVQSGDSPALPTQRQLSVDTASGSVTLAIVGVLSQKSKIASHTVAKQEQENLQVTPPAQAAKSIFSKAPKGAVKIVLAQLERDELEKFCDAIPEADLILAGRSARRGKSLETFNAIPVVFAEEEPKGYTLLLLRKALNMWTVTAEHRELGSNIPNDEEMMSLFKSYTEEIVKLPSPPLKEVSSGIPHAMNYVGSAACQDCHPQAFATWKKSKHAVALESLRKTNQHTDPECIECHSVGYRISTGFESERTTPNLTGVGCESCHGKGSGHILKPGPGYGRSAKTICKECHTRERSRFNFDAFWEEIKH